jgi:hypothetical protein
MKKAEEFLDECITNWNLSIPENTKQTMIEALILYAQQTIDKCNEESDKTLNGYITSEESYDKYIAINNIKNLLK